MQEFEIKVREYENESQHEDMSRKFRPRTHFKAFNLVRKEWLNKNAMTKMRSVGSMTLDATICHFYFCRVSVQL